MESDSIIGNNERLSFNLFVFLWFKSSTNKMAAPFPACSDQQLAIP